MSTRTRIAVLTTEDYVWAFPTWRRTLDSLADDYDIAGIVLVPERMGTRRGRQIRRWYLETFGWRESLVLAAYGLLAGLRARTRRPSSWEALARRHRTDLIRQPSVNDPHVADWLRARAVDVVFIMVGEIVREPVLTAPRMGMINKHAGLLPADRGVFPYFWALLRAGPAGVTFHEVDRGVDTGRILTQRRLRPRPGPAPSVLRFYIEVHDAYPEMARSALEALAAGRHIEAAGEPGYNTFPTRDDYRRFRRAGHRVGRVRDLAARAGGLLGE